MRECENTFLRHCTMWWEASMVVMPNSSGLDDEDAMRRFAAGLGLTNQRALRSASLMPAIFRHAKKPFSLS